jgi:hypothetical protein
MKSKSVSREERWLRLAYSLNGRLPPPLDPIEPDDADTPDVPRSFWCDCGEGFIARRDRDAHQLSCGIAVAVWSGTHKTGIGDPGDDAA